MSYVVESFWVLNHNLPFYKYIQCDRCAFLFNGTVVNLFLLYRNLQQQCQHQIRKLHRRLVFGYVTFSSYPKHINGAFMSGSTQI